jgi:hypothetical protein
MSRSYPQLKVKKLTEAIFQHEMVPRLRPEYASLSLAQYWKHFPQAQYYVVEEWADGASQVIKTGLSKREAMDLAKGKPHNPAASASQYGMAQAVLSGRSKRIPRKVAQELIERTPPELRSQFAEELAARRAERGNPETPENEYAYQEGFKAGEASQHRDAAGVDWHREHFRKWLSMATFDLQGQARIERKHQLETEYSRGYKEGASGGFGPEHFNPRQRRPMEPFRPGIDRVEHFHPHFVPEDLMGELADLWHLSRVPKGNDRYERMLWTSDQFHKKHPEVSSTGAYKDLDAWTQWNVGFGGYSNPRYDRPRRGSKVWWVLDPSGFVVGVHRTIEAASADAHQWNAQGKGNYTVVQGKSGHAFGQHNPAPKVPAVIDHSNMWDLLYAIAAEPYYQAGSRVPRDPHAWYNRIVTLEFPTGELAEGGLKTMALVGHETPESLPIKGDEKFNAQGLEGKVRIHKPLVNALLNLRDLLPAHRGRILTSGRQRNPLPEHVASGWADRPDRRFTSCGDPEVDTLVRVMNENIGQQSWTPYAGVEITETRKKYHLLNHVLTNGQRSGVFAIDKNTHDVYKIRAYGQAGNKVGTVASLIEEYTRANASRKPGQELNPFGGPLIGQIFLNQTGFDKGKWSLRITTEQDGKTFFVSHFIYPTHELALAAARRKGLFMPGEGDPGATIHPNPETADEMFEDFHGEPPTTVTEYTETEQYPEDLAQLGTLIELKVHTLSDLDATLSFDGDAPQLASTPDGRQLYIVGGDQALDLDKLKMGSAKWLRDQMVIGGLYELTYRTAKGFHNFKLSDYFHKLGEETGVTPTLTYDRINALQHIEGGQYQVKDVGIVN